MCAVVMSEIVKPVLLLQYNNARPPTSNETVAAIKRLGFEVLVHPAYSPDLAPSDFYLFRHLKKHLKGNRYSCDAEMKTAVSYALSDDIFFFFVR